MVQELPRSSTSTFIIIREILSLGWVDIPEQFHGAGAPGNTLEYLIDVEENNKDYPDFNDWELKFHGGSVNVNMYIIA
jgi:MvaI/BcnI restriction endonuclease family